MTTTTGGLQLETKSASSKFVALFPLETEKENVAKYCLSTDKRLFERNLYEKRRNKKNVQIEFLFRKCNR